MTSLRPNDMKPLGRLFSNSPVYRGRSPITQRIEPVWVRHFAHTKVWQKKEDSQSEKTRQNAVKPRVSATKSSLHRVSLEAERSRIVIKGSGRRRFIDPEADKKVQSYN